MEPSGNTKPALQPGTIAKSLFTSPWSAGALELARANKIDSQIPWVVTAVSAPVMAFKQFVNVVQIIKASKWLAEGDLTSRRALQDGKKA